MHEQQQQYMEEGEGAVGASMSSVTETSAAVGSSGARLRSFANTSRTLLSGGGGKCLINNNNNNNDEDTCGGVGDESVSCEESKKKECPRWGPNHRGAQELKMLYSKGELFNMMGLTI